MELGVRELEELSPEANDAVDAVDEDATTADELVDGFRAEELDETKLLLLDAATVDELVVELESGRLIVGGKAYDELVDAELADELPLIKATVVEELVELPVEGAPAELAIEPAEEAVAVEPLASADEVLERLTAAEELPARLLDELLGDGWADRLVDVPAFEVDDPVLLARLLVLRVAGCELEAELLEEGVGLEDRLLVALEADDAVDEGGIDELPATLLVGLEPVLLPRLDDGDSAEEVELPAGTEDDVTELIKVVELEVDEAVTEEPMLEAIEELDVTLLLVAEAAKVEEDDGIEL